MKLRAKLILLYFVSSAVIIFVLGGISYFGIWKDTLRTMANDISNQLRYVDFALDGFLNDVKNDVDALSGDSTVRMRDDRDFTSFLDADPDSFAYRISDNERKIIDIFNNYRLTHAYVNSVYMGRENGSFVRSHKRELPTRYDPRERPWYTIARDNPAKVLMTEAYVSITTPDVNIGIVKALTGSRGECYGVVGADVTLSSLTRFISEYTTSPAGKIMLIDGGGTILADSDRDLLYKNVAEYSPALSRFLAGTSGNVTGMIALAGAENYIVRIGSVIDAWSLVALIPYATITGPIIARIVETISGFAIGIALLSVLTLIWLNMYIVRPLRKLTEETNYIARTSNLGRRIEYDAGDEIGYLAESYNKMIGALDRTEEELRASERKYRNIFENAIMGIFQSTPRGVYRSVNPALATIFGYDTPEEMIEDISDIARDVYVDPDERSKLMRAFENEGTVRGFQVEYKRRDGSRFWISINGKVVRDNPVDEPYYEGTVEDITYRRLAEARLVRLNRTYLLTSEVNKAIVRYRDLPELFGKICGVCVEHGKFIMAWIGLFDEQIKTIVPVAHAGLTNGLLEKLNISPGDDERGHGPTASALRAGEHAITNDIENDPRMSPLRTDMLHLGFRASAAFPLVVAGDVRATLNLYAGESGFFDEDELALLDDLASDIGFAMEFADKEVMRKKAESELERHKDHLEILVGERTAELEGANRLLKKTLGELSAAKERAESADRLKSAFLATMSHELRTPLNSIIGFTGIILQGLVGPLNAEQIKQLEMVRGSAHHLLSLINDVLDISKIEAGQLNVAHENFDLRRTIEKAVGSSHPLADKKELSIACSVEPGIGTINGDARRVEQVILNLLSNAIKFSEKGIVTIECVREGAAVIVRVTDRGIGIKPENIGSLFVPFSQIDSGITRKYEGTGLGLSICRKLVELMGGKITVESVYGEGSTFAFMLPEGKNR